TYKSIREMGQTFAKEGVRCGMSDPAQPHTLSHGVGQNPPSGCFTCKKQSSSTENFHYRCTSCNVDFHNGCHQLLKHIQHPYHLQHLLTLTNKIKIIYDHKITQPQIFLAQKPFLLFLSQIQKAILLFFPRPFSNPCDACGFVNTLEPSYVCFQCNYMVHQSCINLPRVIKITRHPHRISYTPHIPPTISPCKICYKTVDLKYGKYSCSHEECSYLVHSKCATHKTVWDGSELEWEPEKDLDNIEDIESFKKVGVDLIKHFCHDHHLRFGKYDKVQDEDKQCQACVLSIDSQHGFYRCTQCDYYLHENMHCIVIV
ncbi:unnamed protein product, partial [Thlaspi arvense]